MRVLLLFCLLFSGSVSSSGVSNPYQGINLQDNTRVSGVPIGLSRQRVKPTGLGDIGNALSNLGNQMMRKQQENRVRQENLKAQSAKLRTQSLTQAVIQKYASFNKLTPEERARPIESLQKDLNGIFDQVVKEYKVSLKNSTTYDRMVANAINEQIMSIYPQAFVLAKKILSFNQNLIYRQNENLLYQELKLNGYNFLNYGLSYLIDNPDLDVNSVEQDLEKEGGREPIGKKTDQFARKEKENLESNKSLALDESEPETPEEFRFKKSDKPRRAGGFLKKIKSNIDSMRFETKEVKQKYLEAGERIFNELLDGALEALGSEIATKMQTPFNIIYQENLGRKKFDKVESFKLMDIYIHNQLKERKETLQKNLKVLMDQESWAYPPELRQKYKEELDKRIDRETKALKAQYREYLKEYKDYKKAEKALHNTKEWKDRENVWKAYINTKEWKAGGKAEKTINKAWLDVINTKEWKDYIVNEKSFEEVSKVFLKAIQALENTKKWKSYKKAEKALNNTKEWKAVKAFKNTKEYKAYKKAEEATRKTVKVLKKYMKPLKNTKEYKAYVKAKKAFENTKEWKTYVKSEKAYIKAEKATQKQKNIKIIRKQKKL